MPGQASMHDNQTSDNHQFQQMLLFFVLSFAPPQLCWRTRAEALVRAKSLTELPWLAAGGLTAERVTVSSRERILLWGTLGLGARALFCLDVTDPPAPLFSGGARIWKTAPVSAGAEPRTAVRRSGMPRRRRWRFPSPENGLCYAAADI